MSGTRKPSLVALLLFVVAGAGFLAGCGGMADDWFCGDARCEWKDDEWARVVSLANPPDPDPDYSNAYRDSEAAVALGKEFYFDTGFSGVATQMDAIRRASPPARVAKGSPVGVSCATCHDLLHGGVDTTSIPGHVSVGAGWTDVNALPTLNSAYRMVVFWNGRADSLWALNVLVAESGTTMNGNRLALAHRIFDKYRADYEMVFGPLPAALGDTTDDPDRFPPAGKPKLAGAADGVWEVMNAADRIACNSILVNWAKAIAAYESRLISRDSPFDRFVTAGRDSDLISGAAKRGARLFVGKAACIDCHNGTQLTDEQFHNVGVPQFGAAVPTTGDCPATDVPYACNCVAGTLCSPWGAYDGLKRLAASTWLRSCVFDDKDAATTDPPCSDDTSDRSREAYSKRTLTEDLKGAWRTPSLRNVALTAPYMHDGMYATLEDVVWHYNTGGRAATGERVGTPAVQLKPIGLSAAEVADLVAFLGTLTGAPLDPNLTTPPAPR
jgi:cytochrome c peroxidase